MFTHTGLQAPLNETECSGELNLKKNSFFILYTKYDCDHDS